MKNIKFFKELNKKSIKEAGGKGASLGEMYNANLSVPNGFVILANAFENFLKITDINIELSSILRKVDIKRINTIDDASEKIRNLIENAKMPTEIEKEIKNSFEKLNTHSVAVRSSATAEDSSIAAWAGQLDSFLNTTEKNLLKNVKKCWTSLFTPRAIFYRFQKGMESQKISVAVVVQVLINSEVSGVSFSTHPVTQDKNQIIIEAGFGLGEAIVSGQITPDSYVVEKDSFNIIDKNYYEQEKLITRSSKGDTVYKNVEAGLKNKPKLSDKEIIKLAKIIVNIEKHYKFPVDIEWALYKNKFYILQSRPITTLK